MRPWSLLPVVVGLALASCDDKPSRPREPELPDEPPKIGWREADGSVELGPEDAAADASVVVQKVVTELRTGKLDLAAQRVPAQRLAFGKDRLVQLTSDAVVLRDTKGWAQVAKLPLSEPRRAATLADGAVLAAGKGELLRVPSDPRETERFSRVPLFMDSLLVGDRREKRKLWVHHGIDASLYPYELTEVGRLETLDLVPMPGADQKGFAALKDGSFVYTAGSDLTRFFPGGKRTSFRLPAGADVWRVMTTHRLDQIWLARGDGKLELVQIGSDKLVVQKALELAGAYDLASNDTHIAVLSLGAADAGRVWKLSVLDASGKPAMEVELPTDDVTGSGDAWVSEITKNRGVALSPHAPLVAVGGPTWLAVWDYQKQIRVLAPP